VIATRAAAFQSSCVMERPAYWSSQATSVACAAIMRVNQDEALRECFAARGHALATEQYGWDLHTQRYLDAYDLWRTSRDGAGRCPGREMTNSRENTNDKATLDWLLTTAGLKAEAFAKRHSWRLGAGLRRGGRARSAVGHAASIGQDRN